MHFFSQPQELAILHDTRRQSTVISREPIELLVISKEVRTANIRYVRFETFMWTFDVLPSKMYIIDLKETGIN